ncbi:glycosyltransferase family 4 protein [Eudoraea chungangensis]|uniref:glycosyltransferase family 4 protein n=1 Tax=Eudoraea chungangensis TaxID=1481905 RepID=UPI0023ECFACF|nr:glycosyltransferase family 4 protein [Eudoraea chungangensis]
MDRLKVIVFGNFNYHSNKVCGQTIKTRNVYELLKSKEDIFFSKVDYLDSEIHSLREIGSFKTFIKSTKVDIWVYLPATRSLNVIFPFLYMFSKLFSQKIQLVVIGGWLGDYLKRKPLYAFMLSRIHRIYPETDYLSTILKNDFGFDNVKRLNNFRNIRFLPKKRSQTKITRLVFMARVHPLKGISTIFRLSQKLIELKLEQVKIDIYGPIYNEYLKEFEEECKNSSENLIYKGVLQPNEIYQVLTEYDLMLFPTLYYTEGFPGSILDAYISGLPVIATKWMYASEFIDNTSGVITDFDNEQDFVANVIDLIRNPNKLVSLRKGALLKSREYSREQVWETFKDGLMS